MPVCLCGGVAALSPEGLPCQDVTDVLGSNNMRRVRDRVQTQNLSSDAAEDRTLAGDVELPEEHPQPSEALTGSPAAGAHAHEDEAEYVMVEVSSNLALRNCYNPVWKRACCMMWCVTGRCIESAQDLDCDCLGMCILRSVDAHP